MRTLLLEEMDNVTGGTFANGKPYTAKQRSYIDRVLGQQPTLSPTVPHPQTPGIGSKGSPFDELPF